MTADLTLDGLERPIAQALRPWIAELNKGERAAAHLLRNAAEATPDTVRRLVILTRSIDVALADAQTAAVRLSTLLEEIHQPLSLRRPIQAAQTTFARLLTILQAAQLGA